MNSYHEKLARILRIDKHVVVDLESQLEKITGKVGVMKLIAEENDVKAKESLGELGLTLKSTAHEVSDALVSKIESDDLALLQYLKSESWSHEQTAQKIVEFAQTMHPPKEGFFLKHEKARQLLMAEPPPKVMAALDYKNMEEMLEKEDLLEIYSAIRFLEDSEWQNKVFFKQYETVRPDDFEEREFQLRALHPKWARAAEKFVAKKYHNVSHLKELGVIFIIPIFLGISGEMLRLLSLLLHYFHEVQYYSNLFKELSGGNRENFAASFISLLRGDVVEQRRPGFLVIQRYLAKDDENDWRLFEPHINPEAMHWEKAENEIVNMEKTLPGFKNGLGFWKDLGCVGEFFMTDAGVEVLISFNLVDTIMALVKDSELIKYLYHQQEAMWNKIFIAYFGREKLEEMSRKYILKGWFEI